MIYDGIIERLQKIGGISIYFNEIISRFQVEHNFDFIRYTDEPFIKVNNNNIIHRKPRYLERYLDVNCDQFLNRNDVFHSTYYRLPSTPMRVVTTVHDFTYEKYVSGAPRLIHSMQKNKAIRNSDKVICVSHNTANDLLKYSKIEESRIVVVHNGVSEDYYPIEERETTNEVVFIGARSGYKNFITAIDTISLCPNLTLRVVGGGPLLKNEISYLENKIPQRYKWLGKLSNQELNRLYNNAYCLLYPSSYEGFGIPIIEAMRAGCPVVALNISSIPEVAGKAAILLDNLDKNLMAEALNSLDNVDIRKAQIQSGFLNSQRFSWDRCFKETNLVYQSLI